MNETKTLAAYAAGLRYEDIPESVLQCVRNSICDTVGAIVFGYDLPWSRMINDYAMTYNQGGRSRILGLGGQLVQPPMAALVNGALAHAFELDGAAKPSSGAHPGATIVPATLAVAQDRGIGGRELITAFVAGTEVLVRIGPATTKSNERRGFHSPSTTGPFAAAVGVGRMRGFDAARMTNTLGIAASLSSGLVQFARSGTGGMVKRLHFGRANESGVLAAGLAERGFEGPQDILEGELGFLRVFCDTYDMEKLTEGLGEAFFTTRIYMKRYACHGTCQAPLQGLEELRARRPVAPEDIELIEVHGTTETVKRHDIPSPPDPMIGQYSVNFSAALSFFRNPKDPRSFDQSAIDDKDIMALSRRVRLIEDIEAGKTGAIIRIKLKSGEMLEERVTVIKATPSSPVTREEVYEKFSLLTSHCNKARMDEIFERLQGIENERDFNWLAIQ